MTRGRIGLGRRVPGRKKYWKVTLPESLAHEIDLMFYDSGSMRITYGSRSHLVTALLQQWLTERKSEIHERRQQFAGQPGGPGAPTPHSPREPGEAGPGSPERSPPGGPSSPDEEGIGAVGNSGEYHFDPDPSWDDVDGGPEDEAPGSEEAQLPGRL